MRYLTSQSLCMFTILWYILTFILVVFCGETKSKVVKSQNKAVRIIKDVPPMEPIYPHYVALRLLKLPDIVKLSTCLLFYEYVNDDNDLSFSLTLCCELREGGGGGESGIPGNSWWGCTARFSKSWPDFKPKLTVILRARFQTRSLKSIPVFRPGRNHVIITNI